MKVCIKSHVHMTKMATMVINSKILNNLRLQNLEAYNLETWHEDQGMEFYKICINHDPGMTLTYFSARST